MNELDELRLEIAKAKGWRFEQLEHGWYTIRPDGEIDRNSYMMRTEEIAIMYADLPDWPRDIAAAWELVEDAQNSNVGVDISNALYAGTSVWKFFVTLYDPIGGPYSTEHQAEGATAPEAICRAWLAWKEQQGNQGEGK